MSPLRDVRVPQRPAPTRIPPRDAPCSSERISLVTTVKNEAGTLDELIDSVAAQTRTPDEWVVVDGGSTDGTLARLRAESSCRLLEDPGTIARGRNTAIAHATGTIVVTTDAGCRLEPRFVERIVEPLVAGTADVAAGRTRPRIQSPLQAAQWVVMDQFAIPGGWRRPALSTRALALRPHVWRDRPYPERLAAGEDAWVIEEWRRRGWRVAVVDHAVVEWFLPPSWLAFARQGFRYMRGDGHGRMWTRRHLARAAFYGSLAAVALGGPLASSALWAAYLAATGVRLPLALRGRSPSFRLRALAWLPLVLAATDAAKMAGYWTGRLERRRRPDLWPVTWSPTGAAPPRVSVPRDPVAAPPTVAIAMVHYHAEDLLRRCLGALGKSELADFQLCVVDNGSGDGLAWASAVDPRVRVVTPGRNLGFAAATNLALRHLDAAAPFVLLLNPDVLVAPATIGGAVAAFDDPDIGVVTCKLVMPGGAIDHACHRADPGLVSGLAHQLGLSRLFPRSRTLGAYALTAEDRERPRDVGSGTAAFLLLRREALDRIGPCMDERFFLYGEDLDLCRRVRAAGYRVVYRPHLSAVHVKGSGRVRSVTATIHFYRAMWIYYRKWGRFRENPVVLGALAGALAGFGAAAVARNGLRHAGQRLGRAAG